MQRIPRDQAMEYEFDHRHPPKLRVEQGESFVVETEDAGSGLIRSPDIAPHLNDLPTTRRISGQHRAGRRAFAFPPGIRAWA